MASDPLPLEVSHQSSRTSATRDTWLIGDAPSGLDGVTIRQPEFREFPRCVARSSGDCAHVRLPFGGTVHAGGGKVHARDGSESSFIHTSELRWKAGLRCPVYRLVSDRDRVMERPPVTTGADMDRHPAMWPDGSLFAGVPGRILPPVRLGPQHFGSTVGADGDWVAMSNSSRMRSSNKYKSPLSARVAGSERAADPQSLFGATGNMTQRSFSSWSSTAGGASPRDMRWESRRAARASAGRE
eukprot:TRINITY_DN50479_c0_g1_i1.p1 TRINITY_DN50479_c0_g1~~TRINITY_DN50479_c0_g1_i1.p1  ORF type:complete len:254 (+),score=21.72 TRINITY_DN50479_c0_g1_i1:39-764(+)